MRTSEFFRTAAAVINNLSLSRASQSPQTLKSAVLRRLLNKNEPWANIPNSLRLNSLQMRRCKITWSISLPLRDFFTGTLLSVCVHKHTHMLQQILGEMLLS